jgi:hypothetical protein
MRCRMKAFFGDFINVIFVSEGADAEEKPHLLFLPSMLVASLHVSTSSWNVSGVAAERARKRDMARRSKAEKKNPTRQLCKAVEFELIGSRAHTPVLSTSWTTMGYGRG